MDDHPWTQPLQAVDIAPERRRRFGYLNPTNAFIVAMVGYFFSFSFSSRPDGVNSFFGTVGLIGLVVGFILLVNQSVEVAIHRQVPLARRLAINWLLFGATLIVGIYIAPLVGRIIGKL